MTTQSPSATMTDPLAPADRFEDRHLGSPADERRAMLQTLGVDSLDALTDQVVPEAIRLTQPLDLPAALSEHEALADLRTLASKNKACRSFIGAGYYGTVLPPAILRNILENPGWYTQYTPYQAEISQGRLEALVNFQTMVADLTALPMANASLLDEATAAAEAMAMCYAAGRGKRTTFLVADDCHPQTINVCKTRAWSMGIELRVVDSQQMANGKAQIANDVCGVLVQYPNTYGAINDYGALTEVAHEAGALVVCATDLLALTLITPPGEWGCDIAVGSAQRFGFPMGYGGPHAAFIACTEKHVRKMPGRIVGLSVDAQGNPAYRLAIQTREQHIKRDKATSNICTAQVLPAIVASMYAVYHGPDGLRRIARRVHKLAWLLYDNLQDGAYGPHECLNSWDGPIFDTVTVKIQDAAAFVAEAAEKGINLRMVDHGRISISLDETSTFDDVKSVLDCFGVPVNNTNPQPSLHGFERESKYLTHPVFNRYHTEHELLRYIKRLEARDLSLTTSMIPLGSCTMKLNAAAEMLPITWSAFADLHPQAPADQAAGYAEMCEQLSAWLAEITGFDAVSLQPNAGSQGEYAGLLAIRGYHESRNEGHRDICLIPTSAHGTNPASAVIAGMKIVAVACDKHGNISVDDLKAKAQENADHLSTLMITYPSTHGVFESAVKEICQVVHDHGGQVYMDGANLNAQLGLTSPGAIGADVCHLNLHKTFCIPHGGGGPGMGPIAVAAHLEPFLPGDPVGRDGKIENRKSKIENTIGPVSAAALGSASILPIPWMFIRMMGGEGLRRAGQVAILNANYMVNRLAEHFDILYTGESGRVAHEFILDCRPFKDAAGVTVDDIAKRLMDYGFHAPTMSWPVAGTLMIEPTESESRAELDRLCDALIGIRKEVAAIAAGDMDRDDNPLKGAPHPAHVVTADQWPHTYSRQAAAYPAPWTTTHKFWPAVGRIDNPYGDRHLVCTCPSVESVST